MTNLKCIVNLLIAKEYISWKLHAYLVRTDLTNTLSSLACSRLSDSGEDGKEWGRRESEGYAKRGRGRKKERGANWNGSAERFPESSVVPFLVSKVENESFSCTHNLERTGQVQY